MSDTIITVNIYIRLFIAGNKLLTVQSLTAFLCSLHTELQCGEAAFEVLYRLHLLCVKVDFQAPNRRRRRGQLDPLTGSPHLPTELPAQLHHPQSWHSDTGREGERMLD